MMIPATDVRLRDRTPAVFRSPAVADAPALLAYARALFHDAADCLNGLPDRFDAVTIGEEAAAIDRFAAAPRDFMLVGFVDARAAAMLTVSAHPGPRLDHCGTIGMGVHPAHRRRGLGATILRLGEAAAARAGVWNLHLHVRAFNRPAIALYEQAGFRRVGVLEQAARVGDGYADEYVYQKLSAEPST